MESSKTETQADAEPLSYTVIENVAGHKGTEALMLDPPLYEVLDPDALDVLFSGEGGTRYTGEVSFEYSGCKVTVSNVGHVLVDDVEDDSGMESPTS